MLRRFHADELRLADPEILTDWERAWQEYFLLNSEVLACWGYSNNRWPSGHFDIDED